MRNNTLLGVWVVVWLCGFLGVTGLMAGPATDVAVKDIRVEADGFIHIVIENLSDNEIPLRAEQQEKIFLTIYINHIKRAEYKLKYMEPTLFKKQGKILFRTNFRAQPALEVTVEINLPNLFPETNLTNNRLVKVLTTQSQ